MTHTRDFERGNASPKRADATPERIGIIPQQRCHSSPDWVNSAHAFAAGRCDSFPHCEGTNRSCISIV